MFVFLLILIAGVGFVAYRATTPEERKRILEEQIQPAAVRLDEMIFAVAPFRTELRARTPTFVMTAVLAGLNLLIFVSIAYRDGASNEPATLLAFGASQGPLTTNGGWWRLLTATFVHAGTLHLLMSLIGLVPVCELLERLVGPFTIALVYLGAGTLAGVVNIAEYPLAIHVGASAAIFGLYGLLAAVSAWLFVRRSGLQIPLVAYQLMSPAAGIFFLYTLFSGGLAGMSNLVGFGFGLVSGLALTMNVGERTPASKPVAIVAGATLVLIVLVAVPHRGIVDVRPQLLPLVANEDQQATLYRQAGARFTEKRLPVDSRVLAELISGTILPQVTNARARIGALGNPLEEHRRFVASASEYLRLREESWRLRAEGWRKKNMDMLREAERIERTSLTALETIRVMRTTVEVR